MDYCTSKDIHISAYMPFGGDVARGGKQVLGSAVVEDIASKTGKKAGQVLVSWGIKVRLFRFFSTARIGAFFHHMVKLNRDGTAARIFRPSQVGEAP